MIKSKQNIPLLKRHQYKSYYFKQSAASQNDDERLAGFDLHNRCSLRDSISVHRLDSYMIFLTTSGEGLYRLGSQEHCVRSNMLGLVGPNVVNSWKSESGDNKGYLCSFSDQFFHVNRADINYLAALPFFQLDGASVFYLDNEEAQEFITLFHLMEEEHARFDSSPDVLRGYLQVLLGRASSIHALSIKSSNQDHPSSGLRIVKSFMEAFMNDLNSITAGKQVKHRKIAEYALHLGVSQNHLNDTVKAITGLSAGQFVRNQLITQATVCLKHSSKSISEISYLLGFEDPSYFSRFFKKQTGTLPSELRELSVKSAVHPV